MEMKAFRASAWRKLRWLLYPFWSHWGLVFNSEVYFKAISGKRLVCESVWIYDDSNVNFQTGSCLFSSAFGACLKRIKFPFQFRYSQNISPEWFFLDGGSDNWELLRKIYFMSFPLLIQLIFEFGVTEFKPSIRPDLTLKWELTPNVNLGLLGRFCFKCCNFP